VRSIDIAGETVELGPKQPAYQPLIAGAKREVSGSARAKGLGADWRSTEHISLLLNGGMVMDWSKPEHVALRRQRDAWLGKLSGGVLLDLGCGEVGSRRAFQRFVMSYEPRAYVGVDHNLAYGIGPYEEIEDFGITMPFDARERSVLPGMLVRGDILEVLEKLPSDSMNVALNGMDDHMIAAGGDYGKAVAQEVVRVARPGGVVLGVTMDWGILPRLSASGEFAAQYVPFHPNVVDGNGYYFMSKTG
jgi:SAM-dependent methyltransferase